MGTVNTVTFVAQLITSHGSNPIMRSFKFLTFLFLLGTASAASINVNEEGGEVVAEEEYDDDYYNYDYDEYDEYDDYAEEEEEEEVEDEDEEEEEDEGISALEDEEDDADYDYDPDYYDEEDYDYEEEEDELSIIQ